jgi:histidinol phosphatase-like PHP family hydrolase
MVIDFHTHTTLSDGQLLLSESARRAEDRGYRAIGFTDHVDFSNVERVVAETVRGCARLNELAGPAVVPGMEVTHVPPDLIPEIIALGRRLGARLVVVHGETLVEPVRPGTNRAAILGGVDILAHPGLVSDEDCRLALEHGTHFELSARKGHSLSNGHVARQALKFGVPLVVDSDAHSPDDLLTPELWRNVALGAGLGPDEWARVEQSCRALLQKIGF